MVAAVTNTDVAGVPRAIWTAVTTAGSPHTGLLLVNKEAYRGSVQVTGTFGSSTVIMQASNDGTNYFPLKDLQGTAISFTSAGGAEFSTSAAYIRPSSSGGTSDSVNVTVVLRE
jgi:hypothetical protein